MAVLLDPAALAAAPREVGLRALAAVLMAVGGQAYRPRFESLERLFDRIAGRALGGGATLHGCQIRPAPAAEFCGPSTWLVRAGKAKENREFRRVAAKIASPMPSVAGSPQNS